MAKVILLSQKPLPSDTIGSWSTLYKNYLEADHLIDFIICPKTSFEFQNIEYVCYKHSFKHRIDSKFFGKPKSEYTSALQKILRKEEKYVLQIVDNYGLVKPVHDFLVENELRQNCYIQFFYHGFSPYDQPASSKRFYNIVDEMIVLTHASYQAFKQKVVVLPNYFSVLHNGIDAAKFKTISMVEKSDVKRQLGIEAKTVFLWCAQDRPKKGLHIILDAWSAVYREHENIELLVVGTEDKEPIDGVRFLGRIPNDELPMYYQVADCFLFSTLCHEGFGLTLIEALHSGCYCIASNIGGVPEVLQNGKLGKLIENPHFVTDWELAISEFLTEKMTFPQIPKSLYSTQKWNEEMNVIISQAKRRIERSAENKQQINDEN